MKRKFIIARTINVLIAAAMLSLSSCQNGNLFGRLHDSGDSSDPAVLQSDAAIALDNKDYTTALALYERILAQNPSNSIALNGAAISAVGAGGLNFGVILSNISSQSAAPSFNDLSSMVSSSRVGFSATVTNSNSILYGLDINALNSVLDLAICRLTRIVSGQSDGVIGPNDVANILNLAVLRILRGIIRPYLAGYYDIQNVNGDYNLVQLVDAATICGTDTALVVSSVKDIIAGYALIARAASLLNSTTGSILASIRDDLNEVITDALDGGSGNNLPAACVTVINGAGITSSNFTTNTEAFDPQSGC